jgi:carbohydrate-binding DOMON domain-containing protein
MSTQYRLVQSRKTASGGCSAGQGSSEPVAPRIFYFFIYQAFQSKNILQLFLAVPTRVSFHHGF